MEQRQKDLLSNILLSIWDFNALYEELVLRNTRSQHILKKLGFKYVSENEIFKYYEVKREN